MDTAMDETEGFIEYLDEDAELVQQIVKAEPVQMPIILEDIQDIEEKLPPLLIERPIAGKKRWKTEGDDSDYDPTEDMIATNVKSKKKKPQSSKKIKFPVKGPSEKEKTLSPIPAPDVDSDSATKKVIIVMDPKRDSIKIPDYDDPLCLPVKALRQLDSDKKRLTNWNKVCMEHFKHCDNILKPERGETSSSSRTLVFRNVPNKKTGKLETSIWSKTSVENEDGDRKSEIFQCVLPPYKESNVRRTYSLIQRRTKPSRDRDEVVLCKEQNRDGEVLVVYKPLQRVSFVYKLVEGNDRKNPDVKEEEEDKEEDEDAKRYLKELACCRMCALCFQTSWRGIKKNIKKTVECPICSRTSVSVYNLLAHFKTHTSEDIRKYKKLICGLLAEIVEYHYKCRICGEKFPTIKRLRHHISTHQRKGFFRCEIGNHVTT